MARKIATIGITINLENYENLRLEVQGEVGDDGNTEELISFLDGMLARLGHGDQATAERVEAYRRRVLAAPGSVVVAAVPDWQVEAAGTPVPRPAPARPSPEPASRPSEPVPEEVKVRLEAPAQIDELQPATVRIGPEAKATKLAARARAQPETKPPAAPPPEPRRTPAPQVPPQPREAPKEAGKPQAKAEKPVIAEGEVSCEGCGLSITRNQEKLSRLLTGKSLCKRCMNPP